MSTVNDPVYSAPNTAGSAGPLVDPTDIVGRRVAAFLLDFLIVGVVSLVIGVAGFSNAFSTDSETFDSADDAIDFCDDVNGDAPDLFGGDPLCIPADVEAVQISFDSSEGNIALLPIAHGALWLLQILLQAFTGATIGKFMTGIRVVREDGQRPGIVRSAVRTVAYFIDGFPWVPPMLLGLIVSVTSKRHRRLGDRLAGTFVVNKAAAGYPLPAGHLFDVRLPAEGEPAASTHPRRDPVTGKLPPPAMPGAHPPRPSNDAVAAGAAAADRRRASMASPPQSTPMSPSVPMPSPPQSASAANDIYEPTTLTTAPGAPAAPKPDPVGPRPSGAGGGLAPPTPSPTGEFASGRTTAAVEPPTGQQPSVNQPAVQQPSVNQPAVQQPSVDQPAVAQPDIAQPTIDQPTLQQPTVDQPGIVEPAAQDQSTATEVFASQSAAPGSVVQEPGVQEPVAQQPVAAQQQAMPDGVMWDAVRSAYIFSDGTTFLQWDAAASTWVPM